MFSIFKKKQSNPIPFGYFPIQTDIHSHILPGIDDGSPNIETSLILIEGLIKLGIKKSIATPHIIGDLYRNNAETINEALTLLQKAIVEKGIEFSVKAAAEYMLDDYFLNILNNKIPLLTIKDNLVLTEFSYAEKPFSPQQLIFSIITEGYQPILAHPERYAYYHGNYNQYDQLADLGFLLQVNLLSLTGYYGKAVAKAAHYIIKNKLVSYTATDLHHERHLQALQHPTNQLIFAEIYKGKLLNEDMFIV
jgi:protein-tyrosine phosphatase